MQDFFSLISQFGFPVVVASYLLFRFEKKLESLESINRQLVDEIETLKEKILELQAIIKKARKK